MSREPRIAVIVIFRDAGTRLAQAIASVRSQTLSDWELLLVDDGSRDDSAAIAREQAALDPERIRYCTHPGAANLGMSASRNLGLATARAPLIAFLDSDDVYLPRRLERHVAILDAAPDVAMVQSESILWIAPRDGTDAGAEVRLKHVWPDGTVIEPPHGLVARLTLPSLAVGICDVTVRRTVALALGGFETGFRDICEDRVFLTKVYLEHRVAVCAEFLAKVRVHDASYSYGVRLGAHRRDGAYQVGMERYRRWAAAYIESRPPVHPALRAALARWQRHGPGARGWFIMLRTRSFALLERTAPRAFYYALVRGYHRAVRAHTFWLHRRRSR